MIKKYLRKNFRFIYDIYKFIKLYKDLKFNGWGMTTNTAPPWLGNSKNKTFIQFNRCNEELRKLIINKKFTFFQ